MYGDLLYVKSVLFGVTGDRRELVTVAKRLATLSERTRQTTIELGRRALSDSDYADPDGARENYVAFEDARSKKAGAVAATEEEISDEKRKLGKGDTAASERAEELSTELKALEGELAPIEKSLTTARRDASDLKGSITSLDQRIIEAKARHPAADDEDESEANLAALRADRDALIDEEPETAAELERLGPFRDDLAGRVAALKAEIAALSEGRTDARERSGEVLAALAARLTVERRALSDVDKQREHMFETVGKAILERRHATYIDLYSQVDEHADEMASLARRERKLEERLAVIDRAKLARGIVLLLALVAVAGLIVAVVLLSK